MQMAGAGFYPQQRENNMMPMQSDKNIVKNFVINSSYAIFL
jgi:hypothetical protein